MTAKLEWIHNPRQIDVLEGRRRLASKLEATDKRIACFEFCLDGAAAVDKENAEIAAERSGGGTRQGGSLPGGSQRRNGCRGRQDHWLPVGEQMAALEKLGIAGVHAATDVWRNTMTGDSGDLNEIEQAVGRPPSLSMPSPLRAACWRGEVLAWKLGHVRRNSRIDCRIVCWLSRLAFHKRLTRSCDGGIEMSENDVDHIPGPDETELALQTSPPATPYHVQTVARYARTRAQDLPSITSCTARAVPDEFLRWDADLPASKREAAVANLREMFMDTGLSPLDARGLVIRATVLRSEGKGAETERKSTRAVLAKQFDDPDAAMRDARNLVNRDPRFAKWVAKQGLGNDAQTIVTLAKAARSLKQKGKLK